MQASSSMLKILQYSWQQIHQPFLKCSLIQVQALAKTTSSGRLEKELNEVGLLAVKRGLFWGMPLARGQLKKSPKWGRGRRFRSHFVNSLLPPPPPLPPGFKVYSTIRNVLGTLICLLSLKHINSRYRDVSLERISDVFLERFIGTVLYRLDYLACTLF